ncbi:MAG: hypothetical protein ACP5JG_17815 [Anaerolineae bacterium]
MKRLLVFLLGVALGVGLALLIGWRIMPIRSSAVTPASLRADYRDEYLRLVSVAYIANGDLPRAEQRLRALGQEPFTAPLVALVERWIAEERSADLIEPLVRLARDLDATTPAMAPYLTGDVG